ncbi:hypothetical protein [Thiolapillus sp.]|uniref:hypothetical protein n=1 Tax=Thiolapillus sp. TaxID=2017437 RepID=UPI003AF7434E
MNEKMLSYLPLPVTADLRELPPLDENQDGKEGKNQCRRRHCFHFLQQGKGHPVFCQPGLETVPARHKAAVQFMQQAGQHPDKNQQNAESQNQQDIEGYDFHFAMTGVKKIGYGQFEHILESFIGGMQDIQQETHHFFKLQKQHQRNGNLDIQGSNDKKAAND